VILHSFDLVQKVDIPAGHVVVTFHYRPPHLTVAAVLSVGAVGVLLALLVGWFVRRRRRDLPDAASSSAAEHEPEAVTV
jgi:LPXTG-motif cell wall-anchored protein